MYMDFLFHIVLYYVKESLLTVSKNTRVLKENIDIFLIDYTNLFAFSPDQN